MDNDQLRKRLLKYIDDLVAHEGSIFINSKEIAIDFNNDLGLDVEPQRVNDAVEYLVDKRYLDYSDASTNDTAKGTSDYLVRKVAAEGRDFMEGKESGKGGLNINIDGDIKGEMVAIGENISQKQVNKTVVKETIDGTDKLSREQKDDLKKRIDELEDELEQANPDKTVIGQILGQIKETGVDLLIGLTANYLFQKFLTGI